MRKGALLLFDYGFPAHEYYHPQRSEGTLMCHYHQAHADPFYLPGLQDVTVHVDFTAIIATAHASGLDLLGYTSQGQFRSTAAFCKRWSSSPPRRPPTFAQQARSAS